MGKAPRPRPLRLADKLTVIRHTLGLSQNEMLSRLGLADKFGRNYISAFELGTREPPLPVLLKYARAVGVWVDVLIDDELDLPLHLPDPVVREGVKRANAARHKRR
ncbi:MAG: helix-turn-helix transcriptional regulator [Pyrinomonadaceae bacterium]